jgi:hypothetical protein
MDSDMEKSSNWRKPVLKPKSSSAALVKMKEPAKILAPACGASPPQRQLIRATKLRFPAGSSHGRKFHSEPDELMVAGFEAQVIVVGEDDFAGETQPQTGSIHPPAARGIGAVKRSKIRSRSAGGICGPVLAMRTRTSGLRAVITVR